MPIISDISEPVKCQAIENSQAYFQNIFMQSTVKTCVTQQQFLSPVVFYSQEAVDFSTEITLY